MNNNDNKKWVNALNNCYKSYAENNNNKASNNDVKNDHHDDSEAWVKALNNCYKSYAEDISNEKEIKKSSYDFFNNYVNNKTIDFLIKNMNSILTEINKSKKKEEINFIKSLSGNFKNIPFLKMDNGEIKRKDLDIAPDSVKPYKKSNMKNSNMKKNINEQIDISNKHYVTAYGGGKKETQKETQLVKTMKGLESIQIQIASLNSSIIIARDQGDHDLAAKLTTQLQTLIMIENMAEQRKKAIDILQQDQDLKKRRENIDQFKRFFFTGFAGVTSYYILKLFKDAGRLITGTAVGVVSLISVGVMSAISNTINGLTNNLPRIIGGGRDVMNSGRDIVGNFTQEVGDYVGGTREVEQFLDRARELGYSTNIVAFMILFSITMIIFHCIRIFESADNISLGFVRVGTNVNPQLPSLPPLPPRLNNNNEVVVVSDNDRQSDNRTNALQNSRPDQGGGYKKKRTRRIVRKRKKLTKKKHHLYKRKNKK